MLRFSTLQEKIAAKTSIVHWPRLAGMTHAETLSFIGILTEFIVASKKIRPARNYALISIGETENQGKTHKPKLACKIV